jgi:hypothetical protein
MNLGMGGAYFNPSAMDAYTALLGRVPSMIDEAQARKRAKAGSELKSEALDRKIRKEGYRQATGPKLGAAPTAGPEGRLAGVRRQGEVKRLLAQQGPAPTKTTYVGAGAGFEEMDPMAMNAYQRELFLPKGSEFSGGPSLAEMDYMSRTGSAEDIRRRRQASLQPPTR